MTISVIRYCKHENLPNEEFIHCGADGRISYNLQNYTQSAIKILPLQISFAPEVPSMLKVHKLSYEIGFTYAGHVAVSLYTYSLLSYLCKRILPIPDIKNSINKLPSIESIAKLAGIILCDYFKDYGALLEKDAIAEILIFGYCMQTNEFQAYHIIPDNKDNGKYYPKVTNTNIKDVQYFAIGSGKKLLEEKVELNNNVFNPNMVREIVIEQSPSSDIGGAYQRACCYQYGIHLFNDKNSLLLERYPMGYLLDTHLISLPCTTRADYD